MCETLFRAGHPERIVRNSKRHSKVGIHIVPCVNSIHACIITTIAIIIIIELSNGKNSKIILLFQSPNESFYCLIKSLTK